MANGASLKGTVTDDKTKRSPLVQGGLEIPIKVKVTWNNLQMLNILKGLLQNWLHIAKNNKIYESFNVL